MRFFIFGAIFLVSSTSYGQQSTPPDYQVIEQAISDPNSSYYYPQLLTRYDQDTEALTDEEKHYLYYGFIFHAHYNPVEELEDYIQLREMMGSVGTEEELSTKLNLIDAILHRNPFHVGALGYLVHVAYAAGEMDMQQNAILKLQLIDDVIHTSGDGITEATRLYIIDDDHEGAISFMSNLKLGTEKTTTEYYQFQSFQPNNQGIAGYYYDIRPVLEYIAEDE